MNYRVRIKISNKMFIVKEKQVRSPFECIISENHLPLIKSRIKFYGLQKNDYEIELLNHNNSDVDQKKDYDFLPSAKEPDRKKRELRKVSNIRFPDKHEDKIIIEKKEKEKIINNVKPIQKKFKKSEIVHQRQQETKLPNIATKSENLSIKKKVYREPREKIEQNINEKQDDIVVKSKLADNHFKDTFPNISNEKQQDISITNDNHKHEDFSDIEVKIEELAIKSSSILEKFLHSEF